MQHARKRLIAVAGGVAASAVAVTAALGSPPIGFTQESLPIDRNVLAEPIHVNSDRVKFQTKGPTDVRVQSIKIDPGGRSGWHHHPGIVIVSVKEGTVTFVDSSCDRTEHPAGSVFVESGDEPMEARNLGPTTARVWATYVAPHASPFRIEDAVVDCPD